MENYKVIKISDKDYGFKFTMKTLELIRDKTGTEYHEFIDHAARQPFAVLSDILICANKVYSRGEEIDEYDMDDLIEAMTGEQLQTLWTAFEESFVHLAEKMKSMRDGAKKK